MKWLQNAGPNRLRLLRLAGGTVCLLAAVFVTVFIRDALSQRNPENTLPVLDVYYNGLAAGDRLPAASIKRDKYIWRFLFWTRGGGGLDLEPWRSIEPAFVNPATPMDLTFTFQPRDIKVYMAAGEGPFTELGGQLFTPAAPGRYSYRVEAGWGNTRSVTYYFRIEVPLWGA